ncbi:MAG: hypothetical protein WA019_03840 [Candidatus Moraniibacteriota bacterium]
MKNFVETYLVGVAVQALASFCEKKGVKLLPHTLADIAMTWRERRTFEWTPCEPAFRRIMFINPLQTGANVAVVFNYQDIDSSLTEELNRSIYNATNNRWA